MWIGLPSSSRIASPPSANPPSSSGAAASASTRNERLRLAIAPTRQRATFGDDGEHVDAELGGDVVGHPDRAVERGRDDDRRERQDRRRGRRRRSSSCAASCEPGLRRRRRAPAGRAPASRWATIGRRLVGLQLGGVERVLGRDELLAGRGRRSPAAGGTPAGRPASGPRCSTAGLLRISSSTAASAASTAGCFSATRCSQARLGRRALGDVGVDDPVPVAVDRGVGEPERQLRVLRRGADPDDAVAVGERADAAPGAGPRSGLPTRRAASSPASAMTSSRKSSVRSSSLICRAVTVAGALERQARPVCDAFGEVGEQRLVRHAQRADRAVLLRRC